MIKKVLPFLLLIYSNVFSQKIELFKLGEESLTSTTSLNIYSVRIFNNTDQPICVPVSEYFYHRISANDTLELGNISNKNEIIIASLFWSKEDLEIDPQQMASYPVILNPSTYLLTNIKVVKSKDIKEIYFDFKHSFGPDLDYRKIIFSYNKEPKFRWKKSLKFIESRIPINL